MPETPGDPPSASLERKLATILSADVAEYSRLMAENEEQTLRIFRGHGEVFASLVGMYRGRIFNTAGDAILAEFASAVEAVRCATEIQAALRTRNDQWPADQQVRFRIGVNLGDVMVHNADLLGDGVNVAARLQGAAEPGGICISGSVYDQIRNKLSLTFQSAGEQFFKNIPTPVRTFAIVGTDDHGPLPAPPPVSPAAPAGGKRGLVAGLVGGVLALAVLAGGALWYFRPAATPAPVAATVAATVATTVWPPPRPRGTASGSPVPQGPAVTTDGAYAGRTCYEETQRLPRRCFPTQGSVSEGRIAGEWPTGEPGGKAILTGEAAATGEVRIEIRGAGANGQMFVIRLTGTLHDGHIDAAGSFLNGRAVQLDWRHAN